MTEPRTKKPLDEAVARVQGHSLPEPRLVVREQATALEAFCRAIGPDSGEHRAVFGAALQAVYDVVYSPAGVTRDLAPDSGWRAHLTPLADGSGRVLVLEDLGQGAQILHFHLDSGGALYYGDWQRQTPGAAEPPLAFAVRQANGSFELRLTDGMTDHSRPLNGRAPGFDWTPAPRQAPAASPG